MLIPVHFFPNYGEILAKFLSNHPCQFLVKSLLILALLAYISPIPQVENCKRYGAHVVIHGADLGESKHHALRLAKKMGFMYINGYDHPHILAGKGWGAHVANQIIYTPHIKGDKP